MSRDFESPDQWVDGTVQEVITEPGEGLEDVIRFVRSAINYYERYDLDFIPTQIKQVGNKYYVTFYEPAISRLD